MRRRPLLLQAMIVAATAGRSAAQTGERMRTIGFFGAGPRPPDAALAQHPLVKGLAAQGYVLGRNLTIDWRFANGEFDRLPAMAVDLVRSPAEVIVALGGMTASTIARATPDRPVVIVGAGDPVGIGLVASLARPGRNVTGVSEASTELSTKRLELLRQVVPKASRIAVIWNANDQGMTLRYQAIHDAAGPLGVTIEAQGLRAAADVDQALAAMAAQPPDAMLVVTDALTRMNRRRFIDFEARSRVPAMYELSDYVRDGGLMAYGPSGADMMGRAAHYVARILGGARPADLPLEQPTRFYLTLNQRTARALGLEIPMAVTALADEIIE